MASENSGQPPAYTPGEEISVDTAFMDLERAIEMTDPYDGSTLPGTPAHSPKSDSALSLPSNRASIPDQSMRKQRKKISRSESMQQLRCRIEEQSARAMLQSREQRANWFSQLTFHWASKLIWVSPTLWSSKHYSGSSDYLLRALQLERVSATTSPE